MLSAVKVGSIFHVLKFGSKRSSKAWFQVDSQAKSIDHFIQKVLSFTEIAELTPEIVHEFIEKVMVGEAEYTPARFSHWARGKTQEIRIIYNCIGDISGIIKEKTAACDCKKCPLPPFTFPQTNESGVSLMLLQAVLRVPHPEAYHENR